MYALLFALFALTTINGYQLYMNRGYWLYHVVTRLEHWNSTNACNTSMAYYQTHYNVSLTEERMQEINFCLGQLYWFRKEYNDEDPYYPSECNLLMKKAPLMKWATLRVYVKNDYAQCIKRRLIKGEKLLNQSMKL